MVATTDGCADLAPGDVFAGHRILSLVGHGGMGMVYAAVDVVLGRRVALKVIPPVVAADPQFAERFLRESMLLASLEHPHIVPLYSGGEQDGRLYLTMRFLTGSDLGRLVARRGRLGASRRSPC